MQIIEVDPHDETALEAYWRSDVLAWGGREDGAPVGCTLVSLPHGEGHAPQDDTLVMPAHRGRRLGTLLKLATLAVISRDHPERDSLHTWTDPENLAMHRTNTGFGYRVVERMHEMQRKDT